MSHFRYIPALVAIIPVLFSSSPTSANPRVAQARQSAQGTVRGVVFDISGSVVAGAVATLHRDGLPDLTTTTDEAGRFAFDSVGDMQATLRVAATDFAPIVTELRPSDVDLRFTLQPAPHIEEITTVGHLPAEARVVSAMKTGTPLRDVPQAVTVIPRALIADLGMHSMADVVRYVPGIGMSSGEGNRDTPIFRGNTSTSDFYVNGVRDDVQYFRDLYNVERVEAIKGPNAMLFGRGGAGGIINRVTRQADWTPVREATVEGGSFDHRRATVDLGGVATAKTATRVAAMYENSNSYRAQVGLERYGVNPTVAWMQGEKTVVRAGYEYFHDERTADRGIPSLAGAPVQTDASTFFGDPAISTSRASVNAFTSSVEHAFNGSWSLKGRASLAAYDKSYQNVYPATAVDAVRNTVNISAYNNATNRTNVFAQADLTGRAGTGVLLHSLLAGFETGRQVTDNFRNTGYFTSISPNATSAPVPVADPLLRLPITFRQSATDADNHGIATLSAAYVQDQVEITSRVQAIGGVRYDRFNVDLQNRRTSAAFSSRDELISPRAGLVLKPIPTVSLYGSYSLSYVPRAGEQLASLSITNQALDPEKFTNREIGVKWQIRSALSATAAVYRLDRGNVVVPDPADPARSLLVDGQRTEGVEIDLSGSVTRAWSIAGGYAHQDGQITRTQSATVLAGARLAQVPRHSFSLWNRYDLNARLGAGLGVVSRSSLFTTTDNTVTLPSFTRFDGALFVTLKARIRAQVNIENITGVRYYPFSNGNNNIVPGSPRSLRVTLSTRF